VTRRTILALLALQLLTLGNWQASRAQDQELLNNPSFESYYESNGTLVPTGWTLTSSVPVSSSGHTWPGESRSGASWNVNATRTVFTMIAYQIVPGVRAGSKLRFSAWANVFTCNRETSCIEDGRSYRVSDQGSQARTRIGVDPKGGTDPNSPNVVWSAFIAPFDQFQQMIIDFTSQNDNGVTVYLYATQSVGMLLNHVYWDDASLQLLRPGQGGNTPGAADGGSNSQFAPPVKTQEAQPDGSIIHIVQPGDTLSSIAYAYKVTVQQLRALNRLSEDAWVLQIGQKIIVRPPDKALAAATGAATNVATEAADGGETFGAIITSTATVSIPVNLTLPPETSSAPAAAQTLAATLPATLLATAPAADTSTPEPTRVAIQTTPLPTVPPISKDGSVCVTAFEDSNTNHWMDADEKLLAGVGLTLSQRGQTVKTLTTTATSPVCFSEIPPGIYAIGAAPPGNYGLTTSGQLEVEVKPGVPLALSFGAASGYRSTPVGTDQAAQGATPPAASAQPDKTAAVLDMLIGNSGLIVFGLAGLVLVVGLGMVMVIRRR
jgi:LysM repeat protein